MHTFTIKLVTALDENGTQLFSGSNYTNIFYKWNYSGIVNPFFKSGTSAARTAADHPDDQAYKKVTGYKGVRYVLENSTDISESAAVSSFSVPDDFKLVADGGIAENSDTRYTIRLKTVYEPEEYTVTVTLNRPESTGAAGLSGKVIDTDYREINAGNCTDLDGVKQTQPKITSIPVSDFELDSNNSVFRARVYAI